MLPTLIVLHSSPLVTSLIDNTTDLPCSPTHVQHSSFCSTNNNIITSLPTLNIHHMTTRVKAGNVKPKIYFASMGSISFEPTNVTIALASSQWIQAMNDEYRSLINNGT